jgi:hypothetical protein
MDEEDYQEDYGEPVSPEIKYQNVRLVANTFEEFLRSLRPYSGAAAGPERHCRGAP